MSSRDYSAVTRIYHEIKGGFVADEDDMLEFRALFYGPTTDYPKVQSVFFRYRKLRQKIWRQSEKGKAHARRYQAMYMALKRKGYRPWNYKTDAKVAPQTVTITIKGKEHTLKVVPR